MKPFAFLLQSPVPEVTAIVGVLLAQYVLLFLLLPGLLRHGGAALPQRREFAFRLLVLIVVVNGALVVASLLENALLGALRLGFAGVAAAGAAYVAHKALFDDAGPETWVTIVVILLIDFAALIGCERLFG